jgi:hypothetical protein
MFSTTIDRPAAKGNNCDPLGGKFNNKGSCFKWLRGDLITRKWFDGSGRLITIT